MNVPRLQVAGAVTLAGWTWLASMSHTAGAPGLLWCMLAVHVVAWLALLFAFRGTLPTVRAVFVWAIFFRVAGFLAQPVLEDDFNRFLWDGRVFALTGNPYGSPPGAFFGDPAVPESFQRILDRINHPWIPTVYGPVCQVGFLTSHLLAPGQLWAWKLLLLGIEAVMLAVLAARLSPRGFLFLAWCPLAVFETAFNAHPDALGVALLVLACVARRPGMAALWCGLAVAAKIFALPLAPFLLRRDWRAWGVFAATVGTLYAPFWLQGSGADLAGLWAMAGEWEFNSSVHAVAAYWLGSSGARLACLIAFVVLWGSMLSRAKPIGDCDPKGASKYLPAGDLVYGALFLLSATVNPWYLLWLLPFVAVRRSCAGVTALVVVSLSYVTSGNLGLPGGGLFEHPIWVRPLEFGSVAAALAVDFLRRSKTSTAPRDAREQSAITGSHESEKKY